jgi:hypothetical protein
MIAIGAAMPIMAMIMPMIATIIMMSPEMMADNKI